MFRNLPAFCLSVILSASATSRAADVPSQPHVWKNVQVVGGGFVSGIVFHPKAKDLVYARTDMGGGYRLDPATRTWIPLTDFLGGYQDMGIESIALDPQDPQRVYFAIGSEAAKWAPNGNLLRSSDQGKSWERIPLPFKLAANWDGRGIGERMGVDPHNGKVLYFATRFAGLWRSADSGSTWTKVDSFPAGPDGKPLELGLVLFDGRSGAAGKPTPVIYVGGTNLNAPALWRSTDAGTTWQVVPGQPEKLIPHNAVLAKNGFLYLAYSNGQGPNGVSNGAVWKLDTKSGAWTDITPVRPGGKGEPGFGYAGLAVDPSNPEVVVVSSLCRWALHDELWRTVDGGATWKPVYNTAKIDLSLAPYTNRAHWISDVEIDPFAPNRLLFTTGCGIMGTDDIDASDKGGVPTFAVRAGGLEETALLELICPPRGATLFSGMLDVAGFRHDDLTVSPRAGNFDQRADTLDYAESNPDLVVRAGKSKDCAWMSTDNGVTWFSLKAPPGPGASKSISISSDGGSVVLVPFAQPALVTRDRGTTWTPCKGLTANETRVVADRVDPNVFYAVGIEVPEEVRLAKLNNTGQQFPGNINSARFFRSTDGGQSFEPAGAIPGINGVGKVRATPGQAGNLWVPAFGSGLFRSTDGGKTFAKVEGIANAETVGFGKAAPGATYPAVFFTGTINKVYGAFRSDDGGANWVRINDDKNRFGNLCYAITGDPRIYGRVYIGTNGRGIVYADPAK